MSTNSETAKRRPFGRLLKRFICLTLLAWMIGFLAFAFQIPSLWQLDDQAGLPQTNYQYGVILTGDEGRIQTALQHLEAGHIQQLLITGVHSSVKLADLERQHDKDLQALRARITLGYDALNTIGNATETAQWLPTALDQPVLVITSNYHVPRTLLEFEIAMPSVQFDSLGVIVPPNSRSSWWPLTVSPRQLLAEYNKFIIVALKYSLFTFSRTETPTE